MPVILITGASSGLGAALSRHYAGRGTCLILVGRDLQRLEAIACECRARGAETRLERLDVRERAAVDARMRALHAEAPLDLVIVGAGINGGNADGRLETEATAFATVETNLLGALNVALPCIALMQGSGRGQIALIASLAAYAPLADAPAYSGTKAALLLHGLALRQKLAGTGVSVCVVAPGYIRTEMGGAYEGWRPLEMSADAAASRIARGLARDRAVIAFPFLLFHAARAAGLAPDRWRRWAMRAFRFRVRDA